MNKYRLKDSQKIRPYIRTLAFYIFIVPLDAIKLFQGFSFMRVLILLPICLALFNIKYQKLTLHKSAVLLSLFLVDIAFSVLYACDFSRSKDAFVAFLLNAGCVLFFSMFQMSSEELDYLKHSCFASSWLAALFMAVSGITTIGSTGRLSISNGETAQDANYVCGYLLFAVAVYSLRIIKKNNTIKSTAMLLVLATLVFLTGSRGGLLSYVFAIASTFLIGVAKSRNKLKSTILIITVLGVGILFSPYIIQMLPETLASRFSIQLAIESKGTGRFDLWMNIIRQFKEASLPRKLFGYGIGSSIYFTGTGLVAHNLWLENLIGIGVVGLSISIIFYGKLLQICWKKNEFVLFGTLMGYMMMTMSLSIGTYKPLWNIALIILMIGKESLKSKGSTGYGGI